MTFDWMVEGITGLCNPKDGDASVNKQGKALDFFFGGSPQFHRLCV